MKNFLRKALLFQIIFAAFLNADNFKYNSHNNHGVIGIINTPTARFLDEGGFGLTIHLLMIGLKHHFFIQIFKASLMEMVLEEVIKIKDLISNLD